MKIIFFCDKNIVKKVETPVGTAFKFPMRGTKIDIKNKKYAYEFGEVIHTKQGPEAQIELIEVPE